MKKSGLFRIPRLFPLVILAFFQCLQACGSTPSSHPKSIISSIELSVDNIQREKHLFQIHNLTEGDADWEWSVVDSETGRKVLRSHEREPRIKLAVGTYDVLVTARGQNEITRHFRRYLTVLPQVFTEKAADMVIDLSSISGDSFVKDFGNLRRPGYKIMIKGKFSGRIKFTGLRGTKKNPVHIINKGQVEIAAGSQSYPFAWLWGDDNHYVLVDGKADPNIPYGFKLTGHKEKPGQILFIAGKFNKGFELCGLHITGNQGVTDGAAAIQVQTSYTKDCNATNWNFEYFKVHNNKIDRASSEGMYIGYFTDEPRDTGFAPYRVGQVLVYRDTIVNSGWDAIQIASADVFEVHDNYVDGASLSGKRNHSSFVSWNNGNKEGYCYRNTFRNCAHAASIFFGETGEKAYLYSNLFIEGTYPAEINTPGFFFSKVYNEHNKVGLYIFHNTIVTSRTSAKIDYRNTTGAAMPIVYAANAILQNKPNNKGFAEIAFGKSLQDSSHWFIRNVWRTIDRESEMGWTEAYKPTTNSLLTKSKIDISEYIPRLKGGFYDRDGYPLRHSEIGYTAGCFSAYQINESEKSTANGIP